MTPDSVSPAVASAMIPFFMVRYSRWLNIVQWSERLHPWAPGPPAASGATGGPGGKRSLAEDHLAEGGLVPEVDGLVLALLAGFYLDAPRVGSLIPDEFDVQGLL